MDRYYLGKLVDDINEGMGRALEEALGEHLVFFMAMDRTVETNDSHMKLLRYLFSVSSECPASGLLGLQARVDAACGKFSGSDYHCTSHFGHDDWVPMEEDGYNLALQFYHLDHGWDHEMNQWLTAGVMDTPQYEASLPSWLAYRENLRPNRLENEILYYCQLFVSKHVDRLFQVRGVEAAFWRLINQACAYYGKETYEELVEMFPLRFREPLMGLPTQWEQLRLQDHAFSEEDFMRCGRMSLRFCQQSMELLK